MRKQGQAPHRPPIWAEGRQTPKFDLRAFGRTGLGYSRESTAGLLQRCATSLLGPGAALQARRWCLAPSRLGRTGQYLPRSEQLAALVLGLSHFLSQSAGFADPAAALRAKGGAEPQPARRGGEPPGAAMARPARLRIIPHPAKRAPPGDTPAIAAAGRGDEEGSSPLLPASAPAAEDREELDLLRKILAEAEAQAEAGGGSAMPARAVPAAWERAMPRPGGSGSQPPAPGGETRLRDDERALPDDQSPPAGTRLARGALQGCRVIFRQLRRAGAWLSARYGARAAEYSARAFGWWMILCLLPWGMGRAALAHLNGQDLSDPDLQP